jgi:hypothetical protein
MTPTTLDTIRNAVAKTESLAVATEAAFDNLQMPGVDPIVLERVAHLIGSTREAAEAALNVVRAASATIADDTPAAGKPEAWG